MTAVAPRRLLVLGGGSEIATAFVSRCARGGLELAVLAGRPGGTVDAAATELALALPDLRLDVVDFDGVDSAHHAETVRAIDEDFGPFDTVLVAFAQLGEPFTIDAAPGAAAELAHVNFAGAVSATLVSLDILRGEPHVRLVIVSSIAAVRPRPANLVYASAKAGLDAFALGLRAPAKSVGVDVVVVRPGFVHSRMTEGLEPAPFATTPAEVADDIFDGLEARRAVIHSPRKLGAVGAVLRNLPEPVWRRVSAR